MILGIDDERALAASWKHMQHDMARAGVALEGVLVEVMAPKGLEMIVGARRDPDWGPVLVVGLGGVWVEALNDVRLMPADLSRAGVIEEIHLLRGARLLRGSRGRPAADVDSLAEAVLRIAAAIRARPEIMEIDVNPLIVLAAGEGVVALDALIVSES